MRVAVWCGSLAGKSANGAALVVARHLLLEGGHDVLVIENLSKIPPFDPGTVRLKPEILSSSALESCEAVLLAAPE